MTILHLRVLGPPLGKGAAQTNRATGATFNVRRTADWMGAARGEIARQLPLGWVPLDEPVSVFLTALFGRPKTGPNARKNKAGLGYDRTRYSQKPDADNISKITLDSMTHAGVWRDDAIADVAVRRLWCGVDDVPCVMIEIVTGATLARLPWPPEAAVW